MSWILYKIRVVNIGLFLCVLAPCFVFASSAADLAWQFFEMAWPPDISGKDAWLSKFRAKLEDSPYWPFNKKRAYFVS